MPRPFPAFKYGHKRDNHTMAKMNMCHVINHTMCFSVSMYVIVRLLNQALDGFVSTRVGMLNGVSSVNVHTHTHTHTRTFNSHS